jgi:predicted porin
MKKSLLALAVIGAFTGSAFAADNVQLYGIIDMGVAHYTGVKPSAGTGSASFTGLQSGIQSPSRIGLKGTEDLGGGLKAIFNAETGFCAAGQNVTGGNSSGYCSGGGFMQRQAYVGLTGGFGTVVAGRLYNPAYNNQVAIDPFAYGLTGSIGNTSLIAQNGVANLSRADQTLAYVTPDFSGFNATLAYTFNVGSAAQPLVTSVIPPVPSTTGNAGNPGNNPGTSRAIWLSGNYNNGPITAGVDYSQISNMQNFGATAGVLNADGTVKTPAAASPFSVGAKLKMYDIFGGYDFGIAKVVGLYSNLKVDGMSGSQKQWMLGATVPVGPGAVLASYSVYKNDMGSPASAPQAKQAAIGYTYALSKRTNLYTSYSHISNSNGAAIVANSNASTNAGVVNTGSNGFALGIRHKF